MNTIIKKTYNLQNINKKEVLRYAGCKDDVPEVSSVLESCLKECVNAFNCDACFGIFDINVKKNSVEFPFETFESTSLSKHLQSCESAVVFAATVGINIDRLIKRSAAVAPSRALMFQAIGAERIEALCDALCDDIKKDMQRRGFIITSRFSPGYGDFDLSAQKSIFKVLSCEKNMALYLNDALLMSPTKSVTAIVGIKK